MQRRPGGEMTSKKFRLRPRDGSRGNVWICPWKNRFATEDLVWAPVLWARLHHDTPGPKYKEFGDQ